MFIVENNLKKAKKYLDNADYVNAEKLYDDILIKFPKNLRAKEGKEKLNKIISVNNDIYQNKDNLKLINLYNSKKYKEVISFGLNLTNNQKCSFQTYNIIGSSYLSLGDLNEAINFFEKCISLKNDYSPALGNLGFTLVSKGNIEIGINYLKEAIKFDSNNLAAYLNLGNALISIKNYQEAKQTLELLIKINPSYGDAYNSIGNLYKEMNLIDDAEKNYFKALSYNNNNSSTYNNLCVLNNIKGKYDEAIKFGLKALELNLNFSDAYGNLGNSYQRKKDYDKAEKYFYKVLELGNANHGLYNNLGNNYKFKNEYKLAIEYFLKSIKLDPYYAEAYSNMATCLTELGKYEDAITSYNRAIAIDPNYHDSFYNLSLLQLHLNQFKEGWTNFSRRWFVNDFPSKKQDYNIPSFNLSSHQSVLVWPEQGIGDQILFSRFFMNLHNAGIKVYSSVDKKLLPLFKSSFPFINFVLSGDNLKTQSQSSIGGLGKFFVNGKEDLNKNSSAYLKVNKDRSSYIKSQLPKGKKICGLSWLSKNDDLGEYKSLSLEKLQKLLCLKDITFVDLQYGDTSKERQDFLNKHGVEVLKIEEIDNYDDIEGLAALIDACDFVVTVSNTTAHIAGAIGKETYLMLPRGKGKLWYWSKEHNQSLWYKSIRIIEQKQIGQWNDVVEEILITFSEN